MEDEPIYRDKPEITSIQGEYGVIMDIQKLSDSTILTILDFSGCATIQLKEEKLKEVMEVLKREKE